MSSNTQDAPRFALGQRVRVIANNGGLYAAQIGVVGVISKQRQKRRYSHRSYDVTYHDAQGREKIVIVREDDLEACETTDEPVPQPTPEKVMPAKPAKVKTKTPEKPPLFSLGERVTVDQHSALGYDSFTRKAAVGEIIEIGKPVRGIRRYMVRYPTRVMTRIREEHLLPAEAPTEPTSAPRVEILAVTAVCVGRGASPRCDHTWQVWPDGRYRHCPKCKMSERVPAPALVESETPR